VSASSISRAFNDPQLRARIDALAQKEVLYNAELAASWFGQKLLSGMAVMTSCYWATAITNETQYEEAIFNGNGSPGYDESVITDDAILSSIKSYWPSEPPPTTAPASQAAPVLMIPPEAT
jgi:hypothetical protein